MDILEFCHMHHIHIHTRKHHIYIHTHIHHIYTYTRTYIIFTHTHAYIVSECLMFKKTGSEDPHLNLLNETASIDLHLKQAWLFLSFPSPALDCRGHVPLARPRLMFCMKLSIECVLFTTPRLLFCMKPPRWICTSSRCVWITGRKHPSELD